VRAIVGVGALTEVEWETIHDPEGVLVKFLIEEINGQSCARLELRPKVGDGMKG
jgi:hypothetical protein